jgi:glucosamine 6-phosphate synthetase-like amidotransferase/phosphosugar isomerase protein
MIDVVVAQEDGPNVVLTLDKRFVSDQTLELLHTSRFTVIGKVTQTWPTAEEFVNTYRRSVISLVPAFVQTVAWQMFAVLGTLAKSIDPATAQREAQEVLGMPVEEVEEVKEQEGEGVASDATNTAASKEIQISPEALTALSPILQGPAIQLLPLAICA